jgi:hypothetical protein
MRASPARAGLQPQCLGEFHTDLGEHHEDLIEQLVGASRLFRGGRDNEKEARPLAVCNRVGHHLALQAGVRYERLKAEAGRPSPSRLARRTSSR